MGRAIADRAPTSPSFTDPTAALLLPDEARRVVERVRAGEKPKGLWNRIRQGYLQRQSRMMVARTVAIDDAMREVGHRQVVILGAGLDGRAWRMPELADATVFEVDHPDTQREKRARVGALTQAAREVKFVAVDFARDDLGRALEAAGHDPSLPTTWIWEGVVMYLEQKDIESTLRVVQARSAPRSRIVVVYHSPAAMLMIVGFVVKRVGEPLKSAFTSDAMRALLARFGLSVVRDRGLDQIGRPLAPAVAEATKPIKHLRVAVADRD